MPNWVYSYIEIEGAPDAIKAFKEKAGKPYSVEIGWDVSGDFLFWNFKKPSDLLAYTTPAPETKSLEERLKFASDNWYDWNVRNWGTKWEACYSELADESDGSLGYGIETAWSIPLEALTEIVAQHPELVFEISCQEEQGWGAELRGENGILSTIEEWDIPDNHADCSKRGVTCACEWADEPSDYYPDCPDYVASTPAEVSEAEKQEQEYLAKIRETIIQKSGVSKEWADSHLVIAGLK